jgi:hypothetical protein
MLNDPEVPTLNRAYGTKPAPEDPRPEPGTPTVPNAADAPSVGRFATPTIQFTATNTPRHSEAQLAELNRVFVQRGGLDLDPLPARDLAEKVLAEHDKGAKPAERG